MSIWGGPCCSLEELKEVLKKNSEMDMKIIKTELSCYVHTHKSDRLNRPELFMISNIDMATQLENLSILLADEDNSARKSSIAEISLPSNDDALCDLPTHKSKSIPSLGLTKCVLTFGMRVTK